MPRLSVRAQVWVTHTIACVFFLLCYGAQASAQTRVWVEDGVPAGAVLAGDGEGWNWTGSSPAPFSGSLAHQSNVVAGAHQHYFYGATDTLTVATGESLFAYVYLDPANMPREVMLQWNSNQEGWNHRAYWGANLIPWGADGTINRRYMGALPAAGGWARLEVPASMVGLDGKTLNGMAFTLYDGRATWDKAGKTPPMGDWSSLTTLPVVPIHIHLLPDRKLLFWSRDKDALQKDVAYSTKAYLWDTTIKDPAKAFTPVFNGHSNLFCAGHSLLPDGRLLVAGGHEFDDLRGLSHANVFNPDGNTWTRTSDMNAGRWYPTNTTLGNSEVLVTSGTYKAADGSFPNNSLPQVWNALTASWRDLNHARKDLPLYPWMYQAPNGKVFYAGPGPTTEYLNTSIYGAWSAVANRVNPIFRYDGSSVMYGDGEVLVLGGTPNGETTPPTTTAEVIDLNTTATWHSAASMRFARNHSNSTVLPDGKVLVTGGENGGVPVKVAELWDPEAGLAISGTNLKRGAWSTMTSETQPRLYHSTAILLPDGRVLSAGGGLPGPRDYNDAEFYSPPYLFKGPRPQITDAPPSVQHNQTFFVRTPDTNISRATLLRLGSVTHSFNQNQRFNELAIVSRVTGGLNLRAPADGNVCPPGHYMLFLLNSSGVPSEARIIQVSKSTVASVATGADNLTRVLWRLPNGAAQIWTVTADGATRLNSVTHGPYKDWSPSAISVGADNVPYLLWTHVDGRIWLWRLNSQDNSLNSSGSYGPFPGWRMVGLAGSTDGRPRVLWERVSDGRTDLWRVNPDWSYTYVIHGPLAGWRPVSLGVGYDNRPRIMWRYYNGPTDPNNGRMSIWNCNPDGSKADFREHGPFAGWGPNAVAVGRDNQAHVLWNHLDGQIGVWSLDGAGNRIRNSDYGPIGGWTALVMSNGGDSQSRIAWQHANGRLSLWTLSPENLHLSTTEYAAP